MHFLKKMRYVPLLVVPLVCLLWAKPYYLNPQVTNSANNGLKRADAWLSVVSVNTYGSFNPGDSILIACGCTVTNANLVPTAKGFIKGVLAPQGSGASGSPITIDTFIDNNLNDINYNSAVKPVIDAQGANSTAGILLYNQDYWIIKDMEIKSMFKKFPNTSEGQNPPSLSDSFNAQGYRWGILVDFDNYFSNTTTYKNISIINNTVDSVYGSYCSPTTGNWWQWWEYSIPYNRFVGGIMVFSDGTKRNGPGCYPLMDSILISGDSVREVTGNGITVFGIGGAIALGRDTTQNYDWNNLIPGVRIHQSTIYHAAGDGIFVNGSDSDMMIDSNYVFGAGSLGKPLSAAGEGTGSDVGIFVMEHKMGIIEYNEIDSTYRPVGDAQAIDNDFSLSGITMIQYNYTNYNAGGVLQEDFGTCTDDKKLCISDDSTRPDYTIFRYNVSHDDGYVRSDYADTTVFGNFMTFARGGAQVYNNTFYCRDSLGFYMQTNKGGIVNGPNVLQNNIFVGTYASWNELSNSYNNNWYYYNWPAGVTYSRPTNVYSLGEPGPVGYGYGLTSYLPYNDSIVQKYPKLPLESPDLWGDYTNDGWATTTDFMLQMPAAYSPCADKGIYISNCGNNDFWGYSLLGITKWNIGADQNPISPTKVRSFRFFGKERINDSNITRHQ